MRHGSVRASSTAGTGSAANRAASGMRTSPGPGLDPGDRELAGVALVSDDQRGLRDVEALAQVLGPQLFVAGQGHGADAKAGDHRQHPVRAVADQRHDDVATRHAAGHERPRQPGRCVGDLPEGPLAPGAVTIDLHERSVAGGGGLDDIAGEVHRRQSARPRRPGSPGWYPDPYGMDVRERPAQQGPGEGTSTSSRRRPGARSTSSTRPSASASRSAGRSSPTAATRSSCMSQGSSRSTTSRPRTCAPRC